MADARGGIAIAGRALRLQRPSRPFCDRQHRGPVASLEVASSQRPRGVIWWNAFAKLAMLCADRNRPRQRDLTIGGRFSSTPLTAGISVVIPSRDGCELLAGMLPGVILDLGAIPSEVIVVDNGSSDGTGGFLRERHPQILVEASAQPLSFPKPSIGAFRPHAIPT